MVHRFGVGEEVVIRSSTLDGRRGIVKELQAARVYRLHVAEVDRVLLFSEECLFRPDECKDNRHHLN